MKGNIIIKELSLAVVMLLLGILLGYAIGVDHTMQRARELGLAEYEQTSNMLVFKFPRIEK